MAQVKVALRKKGFKVYEATEAFLKRCSGADVSEGDYPIYFKDDYYTLDSPEWVASSLREAEEFIDCYDSEE